MEYLLLYLILVVLGLCLGSFSGATVWRLRARQLAQDEQDGGNADSKEFNHLKKLTNKSFLNDYSQCLNCSYRLKWYDLVPLLSWLSLGGKCRKCRKSIGYLEPLIELGVAVFFVLSFTFWPYPLTNGLEIARLVLWLMSGVPLAILFTYDTKWSLLDVSTNIVLIIIGFCSSVLVLIDATDKLAALLSIAGSVLILSGLYYALYKFSRGKWVGGGDPVLGLGLALLLADWKLAFVALFVANLTGCIIVIPALLSKRLKSNSHIPFGPLLIAGFVVAGLAGSYLVKLLFYGMI